MNPLELNEMIKKLRNGEKVTCPHCEKGIMIPTGNHKTTHGFHCDHCKERLKII